MRSLPLPVGALRLALLVAAFVSAAGSARAYLLLTNCWPSGTIPMRLQLDATRPPGVTLPLTDGSTSWNALAASILTDWNANLTRAQFTSSESASTAASYNNLINNVTFGATIYGEAFDSRTLAVTLSATAAVRKREADIIVNTAYTWNSYRGALRSGVYDLRRVLLHESGHVLGLSHPDQAVPAQSVAALMNSTVSNVETMQADDLAAAAFLYATPISKPVITTQPADKTVAVTEAATLAVAIDGQTAFTGSALRGCTWYFAPAGTSSFEPLFTIHDAASLDFPLAQLADAGRYYLSVITPDDTVNSATVTLAVNPITLATATQLANVATRGVAGAGANSMIVGFVITGTAPKRVVLRAIGPGLAGFGVGGFLADPVLTLQTTGGAAVAANDNWEQQTGGLAAVTAAEVRANSTRVGAFALAAGSKDAVIFTSLAPGGYTALVSSPNGASGVVLLEAYDADDPLAPAIKLANLSTRGQVGTGANIIIAGFVVTGPGPKTYLIRAVGDTLKNYGVTGTLDDPYLKLYRSDGTLLRETDDWDSPAANQPTLRAAFAKVGAFELTDRQECAMLVTLPPGGYSAQMSGLKETTGVALIEVYEMP